MTSIPFNNIVLFYILYAFYLLDLKYSIINDWVNINQN